MLLIPFEVQQRSNCHHLSDQSHATGPSSILSSLYWLITSHGSDVTTLGFLSRWMLGFRKFSDAISSKILIIWQSYIAKFTFWKHFLLKRIPLNLIFHYTYTLTTINAVLSVGQFIMKFQNIINVWRMKVQHCTCETIGIRTLGFLLSYWNSKSSQPSNITSFSKGLHAILH